MSRTRGIPALIGLCLVMFAGCVEHSDVAARDAGAGRDGAAGSGQASVGSGAWPGAADGGGVLGSVACGSAICASPPFTNGLLSACCADEATSTCGVGMPGGPCPKPLAGDPRCPALNFMGIIVVPSCCTGQGMCGLDAWMFGMPGCVELGAADARARALGLGGQVPKPRACENNGAIDDDAGM